MRGVNKVTVMGRLGNDPEIRYTSLGTPIVRFNVATNESWTDKDGSKKEHTEWHRIVVWGKLGENCNEYLAKGRQVYIEGKLKTSSYEDKAGIKRYSTEIVARDVQFLGEPQSKSGASFSQNKQEPDLPTQHEESLELPTNEPDSDIPF
jgi:single-strand DNA-binding protein